MTNKVDLSDVPCRTGGYLGMPDLKGVSTKSPPHISNKKQQLKRECISFHLAVMPKIVFCSLRLISLARQCKQDGCFEKISDLVEVLSNLLAGAAGAF